MLDNLFSFTTISIIVEIVFIILFICFSFVSASGTRNVEKCKFYSSRLFFVRGHNDDFIFKQMNIIVSLSLSISPLRNYNLKENEKLFFKIPPRATTEFSSFCPG